MSDPRPASTTTQPPDRKLAELHARLAREVEALRTGEDWQRWLSVAARFPSYSFANTVLILAQRPDATLVAGYEAWKALGRQVAKGERGIEILAPVMRRRQPYDEPAAARPHDEEPKPAPSKSEGRLVVGFRRVHVWDIKQTKGAPLDQRSMPKLLQGQAPEGLWEELATVVAAQGFRVERGDCQGANGWTDSEGRVVRVRADVDEAQAVRTLAHELGHVLLHVARDEPGDEPADLAIRHAFREVEAESVAYIVCTSHGMRCDDYSFPYITDWANHMPATGAVEAVRATGTRVMATARTILRGTMPEHSTLTPDRRRLGDRIPEGRETAGNLRQRAEVVARAAAAVAPRPASPPPASAAARAPRLDGRPDDRDALIAVHAEAHRFFISRRDRSWVADYLHQRGLASALGEPWVVGYAPRRWHALAQHLRRLGAGDELLLATGLVVRGRSGDLIDRFRDRLTIPLRSRDGDVIAFIGRLNPQFEETARAPKYLNSPRTELFTKAECLFGLAEGADHLARGARAALVEGPLDAIAVTAGTDGRCVGVAPCGTALSPAQVDLLTQAVDLHARGIVVATDHDRAGRELATRAFAMLSEHGVHATAAALPPGHDPAAVLAKGGPGALTSSLLEEAAPLANQIVGDRLAHYRDRLHWAEGRVAAVRDVAAVVAKVPGPHAERLAHWIAAYVGVEPALVRQEVDRHVREPRAPSPSVPPPARHPVTIRSSARAR